MITTNDLVNKNPVTTNGNCKPDTETAVVLSGDLVAPRDTDFSSKTPCWQSS